MQSLLNRIFHVRPGEWKIVLLLQLQIFLIIAVLLIAKPAGNAMFLSRFGSGALPYMFIVTALVAAIISTTYAGALRYFSILRVNLWSLGICLISLLAFAGMYGRLGTGDAVAVGLYLWVALFGVLAASQFWMMASMVFDIRQSKRLFGPIGAGAIAGGIAGGYLANFIATSYGTQPLLFVASGMLVPCIFISIFVWKNYIGESKTSLKQRRKSAAMRESPHRLILASKHLRLLCAIIALSVITAKLVDYQFSAMASERFANEDQLTAFFGFWFSTFNLIGFVIQLVLTQRVVQGLGVSGALLFLPGGLSIGTLMMFMMPGLGAAIFSRLVDGSLKQSLHRAAIEMLFLPVTETVKQKIKTYIDVFIDSAAGGIGGLLLLFLIDGIGLTAPWISIPVLFLAITWLVCVLLIREEYLDAFRDQLKHLRPKKNRRNLKSKHKEIMAGFLRVMESKEAKPKEKQLLYVLERTEDLRGNEFLEPIRKLLNHESPRVRARALRNLSMKPGIDFGDQIVPMLEDEDPAVSNAALEYIVAHHVHDREELILQQLWHPSPQIAGPALVTLINETRHNPRLRKKWSLKKVFAARLEALAGMDGDELQNWTIVLLKSAGRAGSKLGDRLIATQLESDDQVLRRGAILAAGESLDEKWLLILIDQLSEAPYRPYARAALIQFGNELIGVLPEYFRKKQIEIEDIRRLPTVLENIPTQRSVDLLFGLISKYRPDDLELRLETLKALNAMRRDFPGLNMPTQEVFRLLLTEAKSYQSAIENVEAQLKFITTSSAELRDARSGLLTVLHHRQEGNFDRLFRLLGLRYAPEDIIPVYRGLQSYDRKQQLSAIEFLDNLLDSPLKRLLIPLIEVKTREMDLPSGEELSQEELIKLEKKQYKSFRRILSGRDQRLKLAVIYLIGFLEDKRYLTLLEYYSRFENAAVRGMARRSLKRFKRSTMVL